MAHKEIYSKNVLESRGHVDEGKHVIPELRR